MAKCWKCGREVDNYYMGLLGTVCPECRTLDILKKMEKKQQDEEEERRKEVEARWKAEEERIEEQKRWKELARQQVELRKEWCVEHNVPVFELPGDKFVSKEYVIPPSAISTPEWWKNARLPMTPGSTGFLTLLFGHAGVEFLCIGKGWAALMPVMFILFMALFMLDPVLILIYMFFTNILMAVWFFSMDDEDFLKRFRYDLWVDKQIAGQYGHEIYPGTGKYTDIPVNKPSWDEAFSAKQKDSTQEEQKASSTPSDDDASKPKVRLKIVK